MADFHDDIPEFVPFRIKKAPNKAKKVKKAPATATMRVPYTTTILVYAPPLQYTNWQRMFCNR